MCLPHCLLKADNCVAIALSCPNEFTLTHLSLQKAVLLSFPSCSVSHKPLLYSKCCFVLSK